MNDLTTAQRMDDPQPGNRFHEMFSFWVKVVARDGDIVVTEEDDVENSGRDEDTGAYLVPIIHRAYSLDEFRVRFAYSTIPGYWVAYYDSNGRLDRVPTDPDGRGKWLDGLKADRQMRLIRVSLDSAQL